MFNSEKDREGRLKASLCSKRAIHVPRPRNQVESLAKLWFRVAKIGMANPENPF